MNSVCYIHPSSSKSASHWVIPAGIFGLINLIKREGFKVIGLNYPMELDLDRGFSIEDWLEKQKADFYLVDIHWFVHAKGASFIIENVKKVNPHAYVVVGGLTASVFAEDLMALIPGIDFIIQGDSEMPMVNLLKALSEGQALDKIPNLYYRVGDTLVKNKARFILENFSDISYGDAVFLQNSEHIPDYLFPGRTKRRGFWLVNGRGCIYSCPACGGARKNGEEIFGRNYLLKREVNDLLADIDNLKSLNLDSINLTHDICSFGIEYYEKFLNEFATRFEYLSVYNEIWQLPSNEFVNAIVSADICKRTELAITVHSGNENVRMKYGKFYTNNQLLEIIEKCAKKNIVTQVYFSRFLQGDSYETLKETFNLIKSINNICKDTKLLNVFYEILIPDPCSEITTNKNKKEIFNEYINWKSGEFNDFYKKLFLKVDGRQHILDQKIVNMLQN